MTSITSDAKCPTCGCFGHAQTPAEPEYPEAAMVCAELYQVIGNLAHHFGVFDHPDVQNAMDNASEHKLVHADLLPWPKQGLSSLSDTSTVWTEQDLAEAKAEAKELSDYFNPPDSSPDRSIK